MSIALKDWVKGRSEDTFVSRFDEAPLGWENDVEPGQGFSSLIYGKMEKDNETTLAQKAFSIAKNRLSSMGVDTPLHLSWDENYTDGKHIVISTGVLSNTTIPKSVRVDVLLGETVHEAAHVLYTDFKYTAKAYRKAPLLKEILNIVEDEYIEREIGKDFPGYSNYLGAIKLHYFERIKDALAASASPVKKKVSELEEILNLFFSFIRFPKNIEIDLLKKHARMIIDLQKLFADGYPDNSKKCFETSEKVFDLLKDYYEKAKEEEKEEFGLEEDEEGGYILVIKDPEDMTEEDKKPSTETIDPSKIKGIRDERKKPEEKEEEEEEEEKEEGKAAAGTHTSEKEEEKEEESFEDSLKKLLGKAYEKPKEEEPKPEEESKRSIEDDSKKWVETMEKVISSSLEKDSKKEIKECSKIEKSSVMEIEGSVSLDSTNKAVFVPIKTGDRTVYNEVKDKIKASIAALSRQMIFDTFVKDSTLKGLRNGSLDREKIVEAVMGIDTVYTKTIEGKKKGSVIGMLIDESGSMGGQKIKIAKELAILFNEAFYKAGIEHYIYGHTADNLTGGGIPAHVKLKKDCDTYLTIYKEGKNCNRFALSHVNARYNNRDGYAIKATIERMRKYTKDHIYLIVISDGQPSATKYSGCEHSRSMVKLVQNTMNATVIGVGINVSYRMDQIYDEYVNFADLTTFTRDVGKLIRKIVKRSK